MTPEIEKVRKKHPPGRTAGSREFTRMAEKEAPGLLREFWDFLHHNKKWWLVPILLALLLIGLLILWGGSAMAPFIYTLF